jgi:CheY-like chemotaxis protein
MKKFVPHVLFCDSDEFLLSIYKKKFEALGYKITTCQSAESCLKEIEKKHPNLLIIDPIVSGGAGFGTLETLHKSTKKYQISVIVYTQLGEKGDIARAMNLGVSSYLMKSHVQANDVLEAAQELLEKN